MDFNTIQARWRDQEITDHLKREENLPVMKYVTIECYMEIAGNDEIEEKKEEIEAGLADLGASKIRVDFTTIKIKGG